ncbi:putative glycoside hydrolase [Actinosynnema sp. NPDC051121]|nr:hypothetical protein [Saccharothrix sp.]
MTEQTNPKPRQGKAYSFWLHLKAEELKLSDEKLLEEAARHRYVVLNAKDDRSAKLIRDNNKDVKLLVYKDISSTRKLTKAKPDPPRLPAGVGYWYAHDEHPEWFLLDQQGKRLEYDSYRDHWQMDVGDPAYLDCWVENVVKETKSLPFHGVYLDNALVAAEDYHPGRKPKKYPTDQKVHDVYAYALDHVCTRLKKEKLLTAANMSNAREHDGVWARYMKSLDIGMDEWWIAFSGTNLLEEYREGWRRQVEEIAHDERNGKTTWVQPHFTPKDTRALWYAMASYFMAADGRSMITPIGRTDAHQELPHRWEVYGWDLGKADEQYREVPGSKNVFRRHFARGLVLVNANKQGPDASVPIKGDYLRMDGKTVSGTVKLAPTTGLVLRRKSPSAGAR